MPQLSLAQISQSGSHDEVLTLGWWGHRSAPLAHKGLQLAGSDEFCKEIQVGPPDNLKPSCSEVEQDLDLPHDGQCVFTSEPN